MMMSHLILNNDFVINESSRFLANANDNVSSNIIDPRRCHKNILHVVTNRNMGHLPYFTLISAIITRSFINVESRKMSSKF